MLYVSLSLRYQRQLYLICPGEIEAFFQEAAEAAQGNGGRVCRTVSGCVFSFADGDFCRAFSVSLTLDALLQRSGAEYLDCYNAGIPPQVWQAAGLRERLPGDGTVIPNYLTPPLRENTEYCYFANRPEQFVLFKADGDQDRPNLG